MSFKSTLRFSLFLRDQNCQAIRVILVNPKTFYRVICHILTMFEGKCCEFLKRLQKIKVKLHSTYLSIDSLFDNIFSASISCLCKNRNFEMKLFCCPKMRGWQRHENIMKVL
ncbi:hypothetical protein Dsin_002008 [Dipteronia sinensis]|uniref:Uncharacterized protein n=1 Tax=Dipteronia sinensis TaxID=43782 RepID=A0AAE0B6D6_9ROSI|nr:hypothetical protein Dsin_002008 [Dipteronia sinensis]